MRSDACLSTNTATETSEAVLIEATKQLYSKVAMFGTR